MFLFFAVLNMAKKDVNENKETEQPTKKSGKDYRIATVLSIVGFFFTVPALGYLYLGKMKKGLIYQLVHWALFAIVFIVYLVGGIISLFGFICLLPLFIPNLILGLAVIVDTYKVGKHSKPILPEF
jgi:hypothetical protein